MHTDVKDWIMLCKLWTTVVPGNIQQWKTLEKKSICKNAIIIISWEIEFLLLGNNRAPRRRREEPRTEQFWCKKFCFIRLSKCDTINQLFWRRSVSLSSFLFTLFDWHEIEWDFPSTFFLHSNWAASKFVFIPSLWQKAFGGQFSYYSYLLLRVTREFISTSRSVIM